MEAKDTAVAQQSAEQALPGLVSDVLRQRGIVEPAAIERFLNPDYDRDIADPFLLTDMDKAVDRLQRAINEQEKVAVYGDYDIDGIVSTALVMEVLQQHGLKPVAYIPDRYEEGYGINQSALETLQKDGVSLVVSVDCGITSAAEAEWAAKAGLDLIITDHHDVPEQLPLAALAIINPKREGDAYPFKELAGVGVAFALARALQQHTGVPEDGQEKWLLDLVALGTVCDVMPLVGENRALVYFGLKVLRRTRRVGLVALCQSAGAELASVRAYHLGFVFGPRLNAAGRLKHASHSLDLITASDPLAAQQMAFELEEMNHQRQLEQARMTAEAEQQAENYTADPVLVLSDPSWPHGVVGIVASKIAEKFQKPTLVLQVLGEKAKGSGRSFGGYNLIDGLRSQQGLFERLGGHHFAAGFTLNTADVEQLRAGLIEHYQSVADELPPKAAREADVSVDDSAELNWELYGYLEQLEPYGNGNPQPVFGLNKVKLIDIDGVGKDKQHLKLRLASETGTIFEAIGFGHAERYPNLKAGQTANILFYLQKNQFNDRTTLQLVLVAVQ